MTDNTVLDALKFYVQGEYSVPFYETGDIYNDRGNIAKQAIPIYKAEREELHKLREDYALAKITLQKWKPMVEAAIKWRDGLKKKEWGYHYNEIELLEAIDNLKEVKRAN